MKKANCLNSLLVALLFIGVAHAKVDTTPQVNFGGGLNIKTIPSDIEDNESPDMSNMINDLYGASFKRNGSRRYISQAISTSPVTSLFRAYASTGTQTRRELIATCGDKVLVSTSTIAPQWIVRSTLTASNQHYSFAMVNNLVVMAGDALADPIKRYNVVTASFTDLNTSTLAVIWNAKYVLPTKNYLILGNIADTTLSPSTTYYPSAIAYSLLAAPTAYSLDRFINVRVDDGEQITGLGEMNGYVHIFKESSIHELEFNILAPATPGDQVLRNKVSGFGLLAPRTLVNTGDYYIFLSKDGIRLWDGGRRSRLTQSEESRVISDKIDPIIQNMLRSGTYGNSSAIYYPARQWYIFSYEDPKRNPRGRANSVLIYDLQTGNWFPFRNWLAESMVAFDGIGDNGELLYGDSMDGYVHYADLDIEANDSRKEVSLDPMESASTWTRGTQNTTNVVEGTASIRLPTMSASVAISSVSKMYVMNLGDWYDKSKVTKDDKISFKVFASSVHNVNSIRLDLEVNDITGDFDSNFTSVTFSSQAFVNGNQRWATVEVALSSFPILSAWTALDSETFPFANAYTFYGARFVSTGVGDAQVSIDDFRLVQAKENPLNAYRYTKQFNFGTPTDKQFRFLVLNTEVQADSKFNIDLFNNFGEFTSRRVINGGLGKDLIVSGYGDNENVTVLDSTDYSVKDSTQSIASTVSAIRPIVADETYIYGGDQYNNRLVKILKSDPSTGTFVATYGSLGTGTTNFDRPYQIAADDINLYVCDFGNQRVKVHKKSNLSYVTSFGTLGQSATSYHNPTGVAVDEKYLYVAQDGNYRIQKLSKSTGGYETSIDINLNSIGDTSLAVDDSYLYVGYKVLSDVSIENQEVYLEKRFKSNLELVERVLVRPQFVSAVSLSTYALTGDISISQDYLYVPFTDDANENGSYYIQKRLLSDLSQIVDEVKTSKKLYAVSFNGLAFKAKRKTREEELGLDGSYLQLRYWESGLDNTMRLYNQSFKVDKHEDR